MKSKALPALGLCIAFLTLIADQILKSWAHAWVGAHGPIQAFEGLDIVATSNTGMAFGLGQGASLGVLVGIAVAICVWLFLWLFRTQRSAEAVGLGLAIGGALSNVVDRLRLGSVRDFIDVYWQTWHWPAFNLADMAIVTGLGIVIFFHDDRSRSKESARRPSEITGER
jgi:signal peptidase II